MPKKMVVLFFVFVTFLFSQTQFYTVSTMQVGSGITHYKMIAPAVPWSLDVLEVDLKNPYNSVQTVKAQEKLNYGTETTSSMAARYNQPGRAVVGAVNGDFYSGITTIGMQISDGVVVKDHGGSHTMSFDRNNRPALFKAEFFGKIINGEQITDLHCINRPKNVIAQWFPYLLQNRMVLFNHYFGTSTGTDEGQVELLLQPLDDWFVNDMTRCEVLQKSTAGNSPIPAGQVILAGLGTAADFITTHVDVGDTIRVLPQLNLDMAGIKELIGGLPKFIVNGVDYTEQGWKEMNYSPSHVLERHPRTALGFSQDSTRLYMVTVDGRQAFHSAGMDLHELADFMIGIGVHHALNLDGGGSTTMVVRDSVVNSYSDGTERKIQNAFLVLSTAPHSSLAHIQVHPDYYRLFLGEQLPFQVSGWDEQYHPADIDRGKIQFSTTCSTIDATGLFTAPMKPDSGYVYVQYDTMKDSAKVVIKTITRMVLEPKNVVVDTLKSIKFRITAHDIDGVERFLSPIMYSWQVTDSAIAVIDSLGNLQGKKAGATRVIASFDGASDTAAVTVAIGVGEMRLNSCESLEGWTLSGENIDTQATSLKVVNDTFSEGTGCFKIDYRFIGDPQKLNYIHLLTDIPISGIPDSIYIDARSDGERHHIQYVLSDENDELFQLYTKKYATVSDRFDTIPTLFDAASSLGSGARLYYPIRIRQVNIKLAGERIKDVVNSGTIYLDNLRITYPTKITEVAETPGLPELFTVQQNFPNPFNATTTFQFSMRQPGKVTLSVYDLLGRMVATVLEKRMQAGLHRVTWDAGAIPSGIYFYTLSAEGKRMTRKLLLLR
ncbi:phosphodiester glycosidase family protein [candidate division KSB1 bacterium]|nr:phosphodiester glycosidase family protein [candidate division KSB1 bacterium]